MEFAESPWRAFVERSSEMLCMTGAHGRVVYVNATWRRILGYTLDEVSARPPIALVAPEDRARYRAVARRLVAGEAIEEFEASLIAKDERYVLCRGWAIPRFSDGVFAGTIAGYRDCTAERAVERAVDELAESEARFRLLSDASIDGVAVSHGSVVIEVNAAWCQMFGTTEAAAIGMRTEALVAPAERE